MLDLKNYNKQSYNFIRSELLFIIKSASYLTYRPIVIEFKSCGSLMHIVKSLEILVFLDFARNPKNGPFSKPAFVKRQLFIHFVEPPFQNALPPINHSAPNDP
jgi:hypothetical protein